MVCGIIYDSYIDIVNLFNVYFVNIVFLVVFNKNESMIFNWDYLKGLVRFKFLLGVFFIIFLIIFVFVFNSFCYLFIGKVVDLDGFSRYFLRLWVFFIVFFLIIIFNFSFLLGFFFDFWKKVKVLFLFKDGFLFDCFNYWLIFVFVIFFKILECYVCNLFYNFFIENDFVFVSLLLLILLIVFVIIWIIKF